MGFNGKHLSLEDRKVIANNIIKGLRKFETAKELNKSQSTIGKEIKNNRKRRHSQIDDSPWMCNHFKECKICTSKCKDFEEIPCFRRDRFIGACNNCPEITQCEKTIYTYIEMGLFKDWGVTNLELRRKVKRKLKKKKLKKRAEPTDYTGRKYEDYLKFIKNNPYSPTTEMDTVYNHQEGPYIQTFIFENTGLMIGLLKQQKNAEEMSDSLNYFQDILSDDMYHKLFGLLLTDRGSEFAKPQLFEINHETGEIRGNIFYCDAQTPS